MTVIGDDDTADEASGIATLRQDLKESVLTLRRQGAGPVEPVTLAPLSWLTQEGVNVTLRLRAAGRGAELRQLSASSWESVFTRMSLERSVAATPAVPYVDVTAARNGAAGTVLAISTDGGNSLVYHQRQLNQPFVAGHDRDADSVSPQLAESGRLIFRTEFFQGLAQIALTLGCRVQQFFALQIEARYEQRLDLLRHAFYGQAGAFANSLENPDLLVEERGCVETEARDVIAVALQLALQQMDILAEQKFCRDHEGLSAVSSPACSTH